MNKLREYFAPLWFKYIEKAKQAVCESNRLMIEKQYEIEQIDGYGESKSHSKIIFDKFLQEEGKKICPNSGDITYEYGRVKCGIHPIDKDSGDENVPYL